jgi:hypothetical protein
MVWFVLSIGGLIFAGGSHRVSEIRVLEKVRVRRVTPLVGIVIVTEFVASNIVGRVWSVREVQGCRGLRRDIRGVATRSAT